MMDASARHFAGFGVVSEIPLPALPVVNRDTRTAFQIIRIRSHRPPYTQATPHWHHQWYEDDGSLSLCVARPRAADDYSSAPYLLQAPEQSDFLLDPDHAGIGVVALPGLANNTLEHLLLDQVLPRLLAGMGRLVVHASLVNIEGGALAFVGRSGWGKSTLAALFHGRGFPALCDDCALLEHHDSNVIATPSYPGFRLYADSIDAAQVGAGTIGPVSDYTDKKRIIGAQIAPEGLLPLPLRAIHVLTDPVPESRVVTIEPLPPAAACIALIEHAFRLDPSDVASTVHHLAQAGAAARSVPMFLLRYPRDYACSRGLVDRLLDHTHRLPAT